MLGLLLRARVVKVTIGLLVVMDLVLLLVLLLLYAFNYLLRSAGGIVDGTRSSCLIGTPEFDTRLVITGLLPFLGDAAVAMRPRDRPIGLEVGGLSPRV
jgi:hypothetical protein